MTRTLARVNGAEFAESLRAIRSFASTDESRPVLCAVKVEVRPGIVRVVGCDSYRLGEITHQTENKSSADLLRQAKWTLIANTCLKLLVEWDVYPIRGVPSFWLDE